ncbi:ATP phosphoribosyltransferase [Rarobacter incanus]|uniref:ATP phosphoribosyltransferase n=1 Tax=Rarobacter incanus TaxID=153494 RepID=A0A542SM04_9MICO|nr:ATP phosphoribosyltransferase [Rarobacter incanus]TQK75664.1 ATP phosphoribosyltransferase (homohexameric) [Rarobacter incanus]
MLRIAVPNKGSLSEPASQMLREAGYRQRRDSRELVLTDVDNDVEFFFLRPRDIAVYVGSGTVDVGITGRDLLLDSDSKAVEHLALGFARSTFRFAAPAGEYTSIEDADGKRIATSYPVLALNYLRDRGITPAKVVRLDGAVETATRLGVADIIADVVETGTTLRAAGLEIFGEPLLQSEAVLVRAADADDDKLAVLTRRLQGVLTARRYVLMDYDVPTELLDKAAAITPGYESPTVSDLHDAGWKAVRVMIPRDQVNSIMDALYDIGARAILVTQILASRV